MCDRDGSQKWVKCVKNDVTTASTGGADLTALARRQQFEAKDFVFDLMRSVPVARKGGGTIQTFTVTNFPSLAGQGLSSTLFNIQPCGINLPHSHPRAVSDDVIVRTFSE
jgi:Cupin